MPLICITSQRRTPYTLCCSISIRSLTSTQALRLHLKSSKTSLSNSNLPTETTTLTQYIITQSMLPMQFKVSTNICFALESKTCVKPQLLICQVSSFLQQHMMSIIQVIITCLRLRHTRSWRLSIMTRVFQKIIMLRLFSLWQKTSHAMHCRYCPSRSIIAYAKSLLIISSIQTCPSTLLS